MGRRLFVFLNDSPASAEAWSWTKEHCLHEGDHVNLITVVRPRIPNLAATGVVTHAPMAANASISKEDIESAKQKAEEEGFQFLNSLVDREVADAGGWAYETTVLLPMSLTIGEACVEYLKEQHGKEVPDEAIVGARHLGSIRKALLAFVGKGSVSDHLVHHAPVSVTVVHHSH